MNMENMRSTLGGAALSDADTGSVSGGVSVSGRDSAKLYGQLAELWNEWDFEGHGRSPNLLDSIFEEWEHSGFTGTAKEWLSKYKSW